MHRRLRTGVLCVLLAIALSGCATHPSRDFKNAIAPTHPTPVFAEPAILERASQPPADISGEIENVLARHRIPGAIAVVLDGRTIVAEGAAGVRKRGSPDKVTLADRFEIASTAKSMSAVVVARLVEQGVLAWDRPIPSYFPEKSLPAAWQKVTLRELLTHTAGLRDPLAAFLTNTYFGRGTLSEKRAAFIGKVLQHGPSRPAGGAVAYANIDYILAAVIAERVTGETWEKLVQREVFTPLGLTSAGFGPPGERGSLAEPWGHGKWRLLQLGIFGKFAFDPDSSGADYPALASPAGFVHLAAHDWAAYVAIHLRAHRLNPHRETLRWDAATLDPLHELKPGIGYAGGWFVENRPWAKGTRAEDSGRVLFHLGENGRWSSAVWLAPERDFAVLVACNQGDASRGMDELVAHLIGRFARPPTH